ncbi:cadherin-like protein 26 isoform X1 [Sebastes umbrosus]|uniref:cadherin-like protein 26 isoform X1 n=1 Tax=Sebastes umbrosus TaxID=72105 RepID=UPI00189CBAB5|nr:cadherin-like protein 26 isoform X1 [Sebastes umbrosus]
MRTISLLLLVALTALAESHHRNHIGRVKRELLARSKRRWVLSTIEIREEDPGPFPMNISQMFNDKKDSSVQKYRISGMGVSEPPLGVFSIDENTGFVKAHKSVDREEFKIFRIRFDILSKETGEKIDKELAFNIEVLDINDNAPIFHNPQMKVNVDENIPQGYLPGQLMVSDLDQRNTSNSKVTMTMISQKPLVPQIKLNQIDGRMAQLTFEGCFNYDKVKKYEVLIQAKDHGTPSMSSTATITLNIVDTNSHPPTFKEKQYHGSVPESTMQTDVLRVGVNDKDTINTPGWRARYYFIHGNEGGNYKIETDPVTNEGILSVIKGKDYEVTTLATLQIGVENEEALFVCDDSGLFGTSPPPDTVNITMKVIDVNDPPYYDKDKFDVYQKEEEEPGRVLFTPIIHDADSNVTHIRHVLLEDPAGWVTIDKKTGKITSVKKMDRESPFVDDNNIYKVVVGAFDDGEPPATGSSTVLVHLGDVNDNMPRLVINSTIMCGNKANKVTVPAKDEDKHPFSGPFTFSLGRDDKALKQFWKLDPAYGEEGGLVCLKTLAYGKYSVPLMIQDQQGAVGLDTMEVMVCDCGEGDGCRGKEPPTSSFGAAAIGLLCVGLLLFLLLLLVFMCQCGGKEFRHIPIVEDEGNQTLIKYNQEGGGSACTAEPTLLLTPTNSVNVTDGLKRGSIKQVSSMAPGMGQDMETNYSSWITVNNSNLTSLGMQRPTDITRSRGGQNMYSTWTSNRTNTYQQGGSSRYDRSLNLQSQQHIADHIDRRMDTIEGSHGGQPVYQPCEYAYEGQGSRCQSLDQLSLCNLGDDLMFLNDLGPKFKTLAGICHPTIKDKNIQL